MSMPSAGGRRATACQAAACDSRKSDSIARDRGIGQMRTIFNGAELHTGSRKTLAHVIREPQVIALRCTNHGPIPD